MEITIGDIMLDFLFASAHAQEATAAAGEQNPVMQFVPFILVFFVFYFLMIRPQKKRLEQEKQFLGGLKKGDEVFTKSGIIGTVVGMTETMVDLEIAQGVKVKVLRSSVSDSTQKLFAPKNSASSKLATESK